MSSRKSVFILLLILLFFTFTRLYKIAEIPPSVYWDEASIGYNAYSVAQTGKDEWGRYLPLYFEAFGEYKLPIYIYATVFAVKILGLNEFAVRIPAVIFSLGVVIICYLFTKKVTNNYKVGLLAAFFVTVSQWFFIFSRTGFEATAGLFFYIAGIYLFIVAFDDNKYLLPVSIVCLIFSLNSYNSFLIVSPVTLLILIIVYGKQLLSYIRNNLILSLVCLILLIMGGIGIANSITSGRIARLDEVGISGAYNHRKYQSLITVAINYFSHFNPVFLFIAGDRNGRSQLAEFGQINFIYLPILILGVIHILKERKREYNLIIFLLLIAPIPASITRESPHALRSISIVPFIAFISSLGLIKLDSFINNSLLTKIIIVITFVTFLSYFQVFISSYAKISANDWQYGYKAFYNKYKSKFFQYDHILISDRYNQPYIFALFYLQYDPAKFRSEVQYNDTIRRKTSLVKSFDKFIFRDIDYYQIPSGKNLIFTHITDKMDEIKWKETILNPGGTIGGYVYEYEK